MNKLYYSLSKRFTYNILVLSFLGCIVPEESKFAYKEGILYIDAFASTDVNGSFVTVSESVFNFDRLINEPITGANVAFRNTETDENVVFVEQDGQYLAPQDFVVVPGESWELLMTLQDG